MAKVVIGIGSSHGPSVQKEPEEWAALGQKDTRDPRFNYAELLASAPPGLEKEITIDVQRQRHASARAALKEAERRLLEARPDVVVVVSNGHIVRETEPRPVFSVMRAEEFLVVESIGRTFENGSDDDLRGAAANGARTPGHPALANQLIEGMIKAQFDVGCVDRYPDGRPLDEAFSFCYQWLMDNKPIPIVPFFLSRDLPNQPTPRRCIDAGRALRKVIEDSPLDLRVALIASGGLSHQVLDEKLDRQAVAGLVEGDFDALENLSIPQMNRGPGTPEILNWLVVGGAMAPTKMTLLAYEPCYRSLASTGHGTTFGYWS